MPVRRIGLTAVLGDPWGGVEVMRLEGAATLLWDAFEHPRKSDEAVHAVITATGASMADVEGDASVILVALVETGRLDSC